MTTDSTSIKHPIQLTSDDFTRAEDPFSLFSAWFGEASASEPSDPDAMSLATLGADGLPDVRIVLLKAFGPDGFVFFTNYESRKANEIAAHPRVALNLHWKSLKRQVRIRGEVDKIDAATSDAYFAGRPRQSQIGAWASQQSRPLDSRATFEAATEAVAATYEGREVPRPPHWGGYRVSPFSIEFWQERPFRLHDRIEFRRDQTGNWIRTRLYP